MAQISELELQNIRHLVLDAETNAEKYKCYAEDATDTKVKQFFQQSADCATKTREQLMGFLN